MWYLKNWIYGRHAIFWHIFVWHLNVGHQCTKFWHFYKKLGVLTRNNYVCWRLKALIHIKLYDQNWSVALKLCIPGLVICRIVGVTTKSSSRIFCNRAIFRNSFHWSLKTRVLHCLNFFSLLLDLLEVWPAMCCQLLITFRQSEYCFERFFLSFFLLQTFSK